jgi:hypothetical protein
MAVQTGNGIAGSSADHLSMTSCDQLCYGEPNAFCNAIGYAKFRSRSHDALIRVYDEAGNVIETHENAIHRVVAAFQRREAHGRQSRSSSTTQSKAGPPGGEQRSE